MQIIADLKAVGSQILTGTAVTHITTTSQGMSLVTQMEAHSSLCRSMGFGSPTALEIRGLYPILNAGTLRAFETFGGRTQETMVFSHATIMYPAMSGMQQLKRLSSLSDQCKNSVRVYTQHSAHMVSCERFSLLTTLLWSELQ